MLLSPDLHVIRHGHTSTHEKCRPWLALCHSADPNQWHNYHFIQGEISASPAEEDIFCNERHLQGAGAGPAAEAHGGAPSPTPMSP